MGNRVQLFRTMMSVIVVLLVSPCATIRVKTRKRRKPSSSFDSGNEFGETFSQQKKDSWSWDPRQTGTVATPPSANGNDNNNDGRRPNSGHGLLSEMIEESYSVYNSILEEIKPLRDLWDGVSSAVSLCWKGYYHGFESLVFDYPVKGYLTEGVVGLLLGTAVGFFHFGFMTTSGVVAGAYQLMRGVESTVIAVRESSQGKVWDSETKDWEFYSLQKESEYLSDTHDQLHKSKKSQRRLRKHVKDHTFYDILQVPVDADSSTIKKAYYRRALDVHPDKNNLHSEREASEQFQMLSTVYKTLVSTETRELYDTFGKCYQDHVPENSSSVDPYVFFAILFGSGVVEPYVGNLAIASIVDNALSLTEFSMPQIAFGGGSNFYSSAQQLQRQVGVALHLRERIGCFVEGTCAKGEFRQSCRAEAESLALAMKGKPERDLLLQAIGAALVIETKQDLEPAWRRNLHGWLTEAIHSTRSMKTTQDLGDAIRQAVVHANAERAKRNESEETSSECRSDQSGTGTIDVDALLDNLSVPRVLRLVWEFNTFDVSRTVRDATKKVVDDCGDDKDLRLAKARALNILGKEFLSAIKGKQDTAWGETLDNASDAQSIQETVKAALLDSVTHHE